MIKKFILALALTTSSLLHSQSLPDFKTGVSFSYGYDQSNKEVNLTWDFFNVGAATNNSFTVAYIASLDMNIGPEDYLIDSKVYGSAVANAFSTVTFTYAFSAGDLPSGLYNFIVYLDYGNKITESNENNNIVSFGSFNFAGTPTGLLTNTVKETDFNLYPNPAKTFVHLQTNQHYSGCNLNYRLSDVNGKEVNQGQIFMSGDSENKILLPESLQNGTYFLRLELDGKIIQEKKVLISK